MVRSRRFQTSIILAVLAAFVGSLLGMGGGKALANTSPPILLVVNSAASNKFGPYLGEILRAEGLNGFSTVELASLDSATLSAAASWSSWPRPR